MFKISKFKAAIQLLPLIDSQWQEAVIEKSVIFMRFYVI
jgi:hypothetical protein